MLRAAEACGRGGEARHPALTPTLALTQRSSSAWAAPEHPHEQDLGPCLVRGPPAMLGLL
mgnify:CR=1 FL=1